MKYLDQISNHDCVLPPHQENLYRNHRAENISDLIDKLGDLIDELRGELTDKNKEIEGYQAEINKQVREINQLKIAKADLEHEIDLLDH